MARTLIDTHRFQERSIKTWISEMEDIFNDFEFDRIDATSDLTFKVVAEFKRKRFEFLAERVCNLCIAYFESKNLPQYVNKFNEKLLPYLADKKLLLSSYSHFPDETFSSFTSALWGFLNAFPEFGEIEEKSELDYLINILKSTAIILKDKKVIPKNEAEVYNAVKILCQATFPDDAKFPSEAFVKTAKCYRPDILIPSLNCAIEYKYAKTEKELAKTIEDIHTDVFGYSDNLHYTKFFAVFYMETGHVIEERFNKIWEENIFPKNWKGIFVLGN
jgi:hypothetical protein